MLETVQNKIKDFLGNISTTKMIIISVLLVVFIAATYYVYRYYVEPRLNPDFVPNKEFLPEEEEKTDGPAKIVYYFVKWCPHCKKATPEWNKVKEELNGKNVNGVQIYFEDVDCEKNAESKARADENNISCYPTIKLYKADDTVVEYNAKPEADTLKEFLHTTL